MFRDVEKARYNTIKKDLFSPGACRPGKYNGNTRTFCLADKCSGENLCQVFADEAIEYFLGRGIPWHDGFRSEDGKGRALPSNHLCCSQSACVNALWPMTRNPVLLTNTFRPFFPEICEMLPFDADGHFKDGSVPFLAFEWIGQRNYLNENGWGTRGANATSADFAFRFRRYDGRIHLVLGEWKYTESYGKKVPDPRTLNQTRLKTYKEPFEHWAKSRPDLPPYETFFVEPFYQLMRLTLLAQEMERASLGGRGEMGAQIVSVVHISPKANRELAMNFYAAPMLRKYGSTVWNAWSHIAPDERFVSISSESFLSTIQAVAPGELHEWSDYLLKRYGWWRR